MMPSFKAVLAALKKLSNTLGIGSDTTSFLEANLFAFSEYVLLQETTNVCSPNLF